MLLLPIKPVYGAKRTKTQAQKKYDVVPCFPSSIQGAGSSLAKVPLFTSTTKLSMAQTHTQPCICNIKACTSQPQERAALLSLEVSLKRQFYKDWTLENGSASSAEQFLLPSFHNQLPSQRSALEKPLNDS